MDANLQGLVLGLTSAAIMPQVVQLINQILGNKKPLSTGDLSGFTHKGAKGL